MCVSYSQTEMAKGKWFSDWMYNNNNSIHNINFKLLKFMFLGESMLKLNEQKEYSIIKNIDTKLQRCFRNP